MTDDQTFTAICADFPFNKATLESLHARTEALLDKAQNGPPHGDGDGTIDAAAWYRLRKLSRAMRDLLCAIDDIENDTDDIPF